MNKKFVYQVGNN